MIYIKGQKVKWSRYRAGMAQRVVRDIALLFHDRGAGRGEWSAARPSRTLYPGKTRYPFYRRMGELQGRSGRAEYLVPTGILSQTVQPVVSRYTDWATGPTHKIYISSNNDRHCYSDICVWILMNLFLFYSNFSCRRKLHTGPMPHRSHLSYFGDSCHIVFRLQLIKVSIKLSTQSYFLPLSCSSALFPVTRLVGVYT